MLGAGEGRTVYCHLTLSRVSASDTAGVRQQSETQIEGKPIRSSVKFYMVELLRMSPD